MNPVYQEKVSGEFPLFGDYDTSEVIINFISKSYFPQ